MLESSRLRYADNENRADEMSNRPTGSSRLRVIESFQLEDLSAEARDLSFSNVAKRGRDVESNGEDAVEGL